MDIKFDVFFEKNLGVLCKDNAIIAGGKIVKADLDLSNVSSICATFYVGGQSITDLVEIVDIENKLIKIPFKSSVLKRGVNKFELKAIMKNGSAKPSQTYVYEIAQSLENPNSVEAETSYPILIKLLQDVENKMNDMDELKGIADSLGELKDVANTLNKVGDIEDELGKAVDRLDSIEDDYVKKIDMPLVPVKVSQLMNDSGYLTKIPNEYITEEELEEKGYLTEHQDISGKADKTELHNHNNKSVLDGITSTKVAEWNNKSTFSGNYNDLSNKPNIPSIDGLATEQYVNQEIQKIDVSSQLGDYAKKSEIPTKTSQLTNDSKFLISIPSGYATEQFVKNEIAKIDSSVDILPNYWKDRLDEISPKIDALQKQYGVDAFQFLWASDIHSVPGSSPNDTSNIGNIARYMMDKHNIPFLTISGDIMSQASHSKVENIWTEYDKLNAMLSPIRNDEILATKGNHDGAWGSPVDGVYYLNNIGTKELFNVIYRRQTLDRNRVFGKDGTYFYVDCPNVRFYMLNAHTDGDGSKNSNGTAVYNPMNHFVFGNEQLNWIADTLLTVQDGQKVIFMAHPPTKYCLDGSVFEGIITSYKNRNSYAKTHTITGTYWGTDEKYCKVSIDKDFTSAKGDLVGYFHGHIHKDTITVDGNYPIISITTGGGDLRDDYLLDGTLTRVKGTPTETAMDLVTVTSDYIYLTRIGCGYDRKYNRTTKEITIDYDSNYIPPVEEPENTLTQGDITHEVGYTLDKRYSTSDGSLKVSTGKKTLALNKIEVEPGDTVRVKGLTYPTTAGDPVIATYKSDEAYIGGINICNAHKGQVAGTKVYFDFEDDLLTVTVGEGTACRYIGIGGYYTEPVTYRVTRNAEMS